MKTQKSFVLKHLVILAASLFAGQALAIQEVPDASINDIATSAMVNGEAAIRFHPELCNAVGDQVCKFFISRQYGHVALKHNVGGNHTFEEEKAADCWVVQNAPADLAKAAYLHFLNEGNMGNWAYGSGQQRAQSLTECATAKTVEAKPSVEITVDQAAATNQLQPKSSFNHYWADRVFADAERKYPSLFPYSGLYGVEYRDTNGFINYDKNYHNGSGLSEFRGGLFYKLFGSAWYYWGPIVLWSIN